MPLNDDRQLIDRIRVSVVIPVLNEQRQITTAIDSARLAGAHEIIVVDGGSLDGTREILNDQPCIAVDSAPGRGTQLNRGAQLASGQVLLFLHADALLHQRAIRSVQQSIINDQAVWGCFQQQIQAPGKMFRWVERGNAWRARVRKMVYGDQGIWVTRERFEQVGGFPDQPLMEDVVISDRLRSIAAPHLLPAHIAINARRWQENGILRQTIWNWTLYAMFRLGVSPQTLFKMYR